MYEIYFTVFCSVTLFLDLQEVPFVNSDAHDMTFDGKLENMNIEEKKYPKIGNKMMRMRV